MVIFHCYVSSPEGTTNPSAAKLQWSSAHQAWTDWTITRTKKKTLAIPLPLSIHLNNSKYIYISKHLSLYNTSVAPASQDTPRHLPQQQAQKIRGTPLTIAMTGSGAKATPGGRMKALLERIHLAMACHGIMGPHREHQVTGGENVWGNKKNVFSASWIFGKWDMHVDFFQEFENEIHQWCFINDASSMMYHDVPLFSH